MHVHSLHAWFDIRNKQKIFDAILAVSQIKYETYYLLN